MKRLLAALAIALAVAAPAPPAAAQHVLNLRDADIRAFIQDAARVTGRTFIIDPAVQGRVSVVTDRPLSRSEYFELFLSTLRANGFVAVPTSGGALRIQPVSGASASAPVRNGRRGSAHNFVTEILRVRNIEPAAAVETLRPLVSREGSITASRNSIVVADFADNVARVRQVLARIDVDSGATRVLGLDNAGAREIAEALRALVPQGVSVVPVDSSNALLLRGDAATVARLIEVAQELDARAASGSEVRVVFLEHADAEQLLPVLQQLMGQAPSFAAVSPVVGPDGGPPQAVAAALAPSPAFRNAVVTRFEGANAIVISAPQDVQRMLGEVIRQLDTRREQVLVEAIIVEISDTAARRLGVQLLLAGLEGSNIPFAVTNYSNVAPNAATIAAAVAADRLRRDNDASNDLADELAAAAADSIAGAAGGIGGIAIRTGNAIFGAIINAVRQDSDSNILSTPSVMTLDNQEAYILVGQEIPVTTGEALSPNFDNAFRTVQRQNVGITLEVTPQINAGGTIKLDLRQEVSSIAGPVSSRFQDLILNKREIRTTITVDDGEIVGIGGLLDDNDRRTIERIPLLGDIPVIGNLFRSRSRSRARTNLMVFIRPTILRSAEDARAMSARRYDYMRAQQLLQDPRSEPSLDELVREYLGTVPPGALVAEPRPEDQVVSPQ
ncbi:MAG: type II secretion system secretin GspD [Pseudomonadota bacterium]|nr:type II secretion system secretin GspD [Pseudomonadota bacterium]